MRTEDERSSPADMLAPDQLVIDLKAREARLQGRPIDLTRLEFDLLAYLAAHPGWVVSPDELYEQVWGYQWGADRRLISVHMGNLRRKLGGSGAKPGLIQTVRGAGYKLVLESSAAGVFSESSAFRPSESRFGARGMPLLGRDDEQTVMTTALAAAVGGEGGVVLLCGEAGIGKTRLAEELARNASSGGMRVLWGRCLDDEGVPAYWPWVQMLRELRDELGTEGLIALAGAGDEPLLQLLPELRRSSTSEPPSDHFGDQYLVFDSLSRLLVRVSLERSNLLIVDDLQWADPSSLALLQVLAPRIKQSRMLLVGALRAADLSRKPTLARVLPALVRCGARRIDLGGLAQHDVERLMAAATGVGSEPALVQAVAAETLGNPLHVCELVRLVRDGQPSADCLALPGTLPLPPTISEVVAQRLGGLSVPCQELLELCALAGRSLNIWLLDRAAELERGELLLLIEEALDAEILEEESSAGRYRFGHPIIQEALLSKLGHLRRLKLHARLGEALATLNNHDREYHLADLAHHFYEATPLGHAGQAVLWNLRAGRQARNQLAFERAAGHFTRSLEALGFAEEPDSRLQAELLVELAEARAAAFDPAARLTYLEAANVARVVQAPDLLARAALGFDGRMLAPYYVDSERAQVLEEALVLLPPDDSALRVSLMSVLAKGLAELATPRAPADDPFSRKRRQRLCDEAVSMARRLDDPALLASALSARWYALYSPDNLMERLADAAEALALAGPASGPILGWNSTKCWSFQMLEMERMQESVEYMNSCNDLAERFRVPFFMSVSACFRGMRAAWNGHLEEALRLTEESATCWRDNQDWLGSAMSLLLAFLTEDLSGDASRLGRLEASVRAMIPYDPLGWAWRARLALLLARLGRDAEARDILDEMGSHDFADLPREHGFTLIAGHLAAASSLLGDARSATALDKLMLPYEDRAVTAYGYFDGPVAHYLGILARTMQDWERAEAHLSDSIARCRDMATPAYRVRSEIELAETLLVRDRPSDQTRAHHLLQDSLPKARAMGMTGWADRAQALLSTRSAR